MTTQYEGTGGTKTSVTGQVKVTISNEDYALGEAIVEYCDKTTNGGYQYTTGVGYVFFHIRQ
ncbi:MAG: hypothetical protein ACK5WO_01230 [Cyclobacteriaceae bacterium]|jgi:hypothetical protein|nr:hypothetical protein [Flammeovirgaceae bacterium]